MKQHIWNQHKWHKEIKAWADGAEIQWKWVHKTDGFHAMTKDNHPDLWQQDEIELRIAPQHILVDDFTKMLDEKDKWEANEMAKHKWHKEIKAWADGAEIECRKFGKDEWNDTNPQWNDLFEYRIKPTPKEPQYLYVYNDGGYAHLSFAKPNKESNYIGKIKLEDESC